MNDHQPKHPAAAGAHWSQFHPALALVPEGLRV